jgi:hypothetical protein
VNFPSRGTLEFWELYRGLPLQVKRLARKNYRLWSEEPFHASLHFKKIGGDKWSVRIGINYRAVGKFNGSYSAWDWIGPHSEYDQLA